MRPIPAPRIGDSHGLLRAIEQRGRLRTDEFVTEFTLEQLFPPDLENALGRTRHFVSYARSAGLVKEDRGVVELTEVGRRYIKAGDEGAPFDVSPQQAEWLRRQLREKHMTDSIFHGMAIGLSLLASIAPGSRVSTLDFGRSLAYLGRAGWDNENTFLIQGERYLTLLTDVELIDGRHRLTATGEQVRGELTLPVHMSLLDIAAQLNPGGAEAVRADADTEWAAPEPEAEEPAYENAGPGAPAPAASNGEGHLPAAAPEAPVPPADIWETSGPEEATKAIPSARPPIVPRASDPGTPTPSVEGYETVVGGPTPAAAGGNVPAAGAPAAGDVAAAGGPPAGDVAAAGAAGAGDVAAPGGPAAGDVAAAGEAAARAAAPSEFAGGAPGGSPAAAGPPAGNPAAGAVPGIGAPAAGDVPAAAGAPAAGYAPVSPPPAVDAARAAADLAARAGAPAGSPPVPADVAARAAAAAGLAGGAGAPAGSPPVPADVAAAAAGLAGAPPVPGDIAARAAAAAPPAVPGDVAAQASAAADLAARGVAPAGTPSIPGDVAARAAAAAAGLAGGAGAPAGSPPVPADVAAAAAGLAGAAPVPGDIAARAAAAAPPAVAGDVAARAAAAAPSRVSDLRSDVSAFVDPVAIRAAAEASGLRFAASVYANVAAALAGGKHVLLTGAPGAGKTSLALAVARAAAQAGRAHGATLVTARTEWDDRGLLIESAKRGRWVIADELDRADLDRALGELSSFLAGLPVLLPSGEEAEPDTSWRIVATAARPPRASAALLRRFAVVDVPPPAGHDLVEALNAAARGDATAAAAAARLLPLAEIAPLGAGVFLDAARHAAARNAAAPADEAALARDAYTAYVAPLLGEIDDDAARRVRELVGEG